MIILLSWAEVEVGEPLPINIIDSHEVLKPDGGILTPAVAHVEMRKAKVWQWVSITNHACPSGSGRPLSDAPSSNHKLAKTVLKRNGTINTIVGNFRNGKEACDYLKIDPNKGSANLALVNAGYVLDDYSGNDFLVPEK